MADQLRYTLRKTLIGYPHQDCVLMRTRIEADPDVFNTLQVYVLCAPHLEIGGWHNNAEALDTKAGRIIVAFKGSTWMALGATAPLMHCSCGYVAVNDGWTDLHDNRSLDWQYEAVYDGNIAVTAQIDLACGADFTLGLAFGDTRHRAITNLFQSLVTPFDVHVQRFREEWNRAARRFALAATAPDRAALLLYERSVNLLLAHEDKSYPGAMIAALSIPWGGSKGDEELGGYHLVWTRDLVQSATALLAAGDLATPLRVLVYLAVSQQANGGFAQNFWIDGRPYWTLHPTVSRHYIRINPNADGREDPNTGMLILANQPPDVPYEHPAKDIVDAGFLELVRYGIRDPHDPVIVDSLTVVDAVLKVDMPQGPFWRRYNHDGYGQRADGTSFKGWGIGRPWPLLTGERGHYELAAGRDARLYLRTMQQSAVGIGLIPEQIWDQSAIPDKLLIPGGPTGAVIPLGWAHAEYIKLVRSIADQCVFDLIAPVHARYAGRTQHDRILSEVWSRKRPIQSIPTGCRLRVIADVEFTLRWTSNDWQDRREAVSIGTRLGVWFVDVPAPAPSLLRLRLMSGDQVDEATVEIV